ncbi:MAG: hypothetical protein HKL95_11550 [Phycisphaerae bacterium]|nr:hypothetical protein [Phycisphaerae bacterium]
MNRQIYLDIAAQGARVPVGADLVLRQRADPEAIVLDGRRLAEVWMQAADTYHTSLAFPVMDLLLEKAALLSLLEITEDAQTFHFQAGSDAGLVARLQSHLARPLPPRMQAHVEAIRMIAQRGPGRYIPMGMSIGPVSLMTKLLADPITPLFMAGSGTTARDDEDVRMLDVVSELAVLMVLRYVQAQIDAGAVAVFIAEPAANLAYFSPRQIEGGSDVWHRYVMMGNRRIADLLQQHGADLIFHCCGELTDAMVKSFGSLNPVVLSLGSSRKLWEDAALVPADTVLYGNLPTKLFYSDETMPGEKVADMTCELLQKMRLANHPFILGSECDVLSVPGSEATIQRKINVMLHCSCA